MDEPKYPKGIDKKMLDAVKRCMEDFNNGIGIVAYHAGHCGIDISQDPIKKFVDSLEEDIQDYMKEKNDKIAELEAIIKDKDDIIYDLEQDVSMYRNTIEADRYDDDDE